MPDNKPDVKYVKYHMFSLRKYIEEDKGSALLQWSSRQGYPRITVFTGANAIQNGVLDRSKVITAPLDNLSLGTILGLLSKTIEAKEEQQYVIECYTNIWENDKRTDKKRLCSKIIIGKSKNLINYIAVVEDEKRKVKFDIVPTSEYIKYFNKDGTEITNTPELSDLFAKSYVNGLAKAFELELAQEAVKTLEERIGYNPNAKSDTSDDLLI